MLGLPGVARAEDDADAAAYGTRDRGVWYALIGVGGDEELMGYGSSSGRSVGTLTGDAFLWRGTTYTVENVFYNSLESGVDDWRLVVDISPALSEGIECLALYAGGRWLNFADARRSGRQFVWYGVDLDWTLGSESVIGLREFPPAFEPRSIDGWGNNRAHPEMGMAGTVLARRAPVSFEYAMSAAIPAELPNGRLISSMVASQTGPIENAAGATDMVWQWGQFLDHDLSLTPAAEPKESLPIPVSAGDPFFDPMGTGMQTIAFSRSAHDPATGSGPDNPRQQINAISAFIDASNVYGSDVCRSRALRTGDDTGKLSTSGGGRFLPYNEGGLDNEGGSGRPDLFLAGDTRANEQVGLTALHTLFAREHNRLAEAIASEDPDLSGHEIFELARKIVGAQMQVITYSEFLPLLLGPGAIGPYGGYDPEVDPSVASEFSAAAYRVGHTMLSPGLLVIDDQGKEHSLSLIKAFFNPSLVADQGISGILRGLATQRAQEVDPLLVDEVRNLLFGAAGGTARDLAALNIQRGRDHGLPGYNVVRSAYGLPPAESFADITSDPGMQEALGLAYEGVERVDIWTGGLAEDQVPGAMVGETFRTIIADQFRRLRDGDRYWFENDPYFLWNVDMLTELRSTTLADIIRRNTEIGDEVSDNVFGGSLEPPSGDDRGDAARSSAGEKIETREDSPSDIGGSATQTVFSGALYSWSL